MARRYLTKAQVVTECREAFRNYPQTFRGDVTARREYFNDLTDSLIKSGQLPERAYHWTNPF